VFFLSRFSCQEDIVPLGVEGTRLYRVQGYDCPNNDRQSSNDHVRDPLWGAPHDHRRRRTKTQRCRTATTWPLGLLGRAAREGERSATVPGPWTDRGTLLAEPGRGLGRIFPTTSRAAARPLRGRSPSPWWRRTRRTSANGPDSNFGVARQHFHDSSMCGPGRRASGRAWRPRPTGRWRSVREAPPLSQGADNQEEHTEATNCKQRPTQIEQNDVIAAYIV